MLVQPAVGRHAADFADGLKSAQRDRQRRREPLLLPFFSQVPGGAPGRGTQLLGIERPLGQGLEDSRAELLNLGLGHPELLGCLHLIRETLTDLQGQGEVGGGDDVCAAPGTGEFMNLHPGDGIVRRLPADRGARKKGQIWPDPPDRSRPSRLLEHLPRRLAGEP